MRALAFRRTTALEQVNVVEVSLVLLSQRLCITDQNISPNHLHLIKFARDSSVYSMIGVNQESVHNRELSLQRRSGALSVRVVEGWDKL